MDHLRKIKKRTKKFKETGDINYIYKNEFDKASFQHDMTYVDFKDLPKRTTSDKVLRDKPFNIAKNPEYDGYQTRFASMIYKFFDKNSAGSGVNLHANNEKLAEESHKQVIKKIKNVLHDLKTIFGVLI